MFLQSTRRPTDAKAVWQKCEARGCDHCGPMLRERDLAHDTGNLTRDGRLILRRLIDLQAWNALRAKLKRAGSGWVAYPRADGTLAVYAHAGMTGALVTCLADELASDYAGIPPNGRIRRPREWALHTAPAKPAGQPAYRPVGVSAVIDRTPDILRHLDLYRGEVDEAAVPQNAWSVHDFTMPPEHSDAYRLLEQVFEMEWGRARPSKRRRPREAAA